MANSGFFRRTLTPRKRFVWLFGVLFVIGAAIFLFTPHGKKKTVAIATPQTKEAALQDLNADSDNDGLKNWEEKIYGTDPNNPDSDGDGTPDGEEIKEGRNPLVAGHKLPDGTWSDALSIPLPPPADSDKTAALANEIIGHSLTQIVAGAVAGVPLNTTQAESQAEAYAATLADTQLLDKVIPPAESEFTTKTDNSPAAVRAYFNAVAQIYINRFSDIDSDISVLYLATQSGDAKAFRRLDANVSAITDAIAEIKKTPVPSRWLSFAKNDVWYLMKTRTAVAILQNTENDPVSSLLILQPRLLLIQDIKTFYSDTRASLQNTGITFSQNEPASQLLLQQ